MQNSPDITLPASTFSLVVALRSAVRRLAPGELGFLDDVLSAWEREDLAHQQGRGRGAGAGTVGFGADFTLITETVLAVVTGAAAEVLGTVATDVWQRRPRRRRPASAGQVSAAQQPIALTAEQADRLRDACLRHARTLGLTAEQADLLADAVRGAVDGPAEP